MSSGIISRNFCVRISIVEALAQVNRELGTMTAVITHNAGIAAMADRVVTMRSGQIINVQQNENKVAPGELEW